MPIIVKENENDTGINILNLCEYTTKTTMSSLAGTAVDGFNCSNGNGIQNVLNSNQAFYKQTGSEAENIYPDPLKGKFLVNGKPQYFTPNGGVMSNSTKTFAGGYATADSDGSSDTYVFKTTYDKSTRKYFLYYSTNNGSTWTKVFNKKIKSFNLEFCGSGASGTSAKFTAGAYAASCDGGGGGGGAGSIVVKIVPLHTSDEYSVITGYPAPQRTTGNSELTSVTKWLYAGS